MFEYMNPLLIFATLATIFVALLITLYEAGRSQAEGGKFSVPYLLYIGVIVMIIIMFSDAKDTKDLLSRNKKLLQYNKVLQCQAVGKSYVVSKEEGWKILDTRNFTNGEIILSIVSCRELKAAY